MPAPLPTLSTATLRLGQLAASVLLLLATIGLSSAAFAAPQGAPQTPAWAKPKLGPGAPGASADGGPPGGAEPGADMGMDIYGDSRDRVDTSIKVDKTQILPGSDFVIAVVMDIAHGFHLWPTKNAPPPAEDPALRPMEGAILTEIALPVDPNDAKKRLSPEGITVHLGHMQLPKVHAANANGGRIPAFEGYSIFYIPATVAANATPGKRTIEFIITIQACDDSACRNPVDFPITVDIEVLAPGATPTATARADGDFKGFDIGVFDRIRAGETPPEIVTFDILGHVFKIDARGVGFFLLLLVAAAGGLLLNFTPCVLPVIPLKIMGLANAGGSRGRTLWLGVVMSLGVIAFWMGLGVAVSSVTGFTSANQLFQYPLVTMSIGLIIVAMAIGMMGFFTVGLPQWVYLVNPKHESATGSFFFGIMTAVLSTPCTAPLMGAAIAWAATRDVVTVLTVFAAVGVGMALPYGVLAAFPSLLKSMPRTGPASELIKQVMGLLLLAAGIFFIGSGLSGWTVTPPDPPSKFFWWLVAAAGVIAGAWLTYKTIRITSSNGRRTVFGGLGVVIVAISAFIGVSQTSPGPIKWTYYTPERLAEAKARGDVIVIDFTAEWCLNCKTLESTVLNPPSVSKLLNQTGVAPIKVDITGNNAAGNALLKEFDRITIPLLVVLKPDGTEVMKSDIYHADQVIDALRTASGGKIAPPSGAEPNLTPVSNNATR